MLQRSVLLCLLSLGLLSAQTRGRASATAVMNLDEIARRPSSRVPAIAPRRVIPEHERPQFPKRKSAARKVEVRAASAAAAGSSPVSYTGFPALLDNFTVIPPDTGGAVSPLYVVTMLNTQMQIQSRDGVVRENYPITLDAFWSSLGTPLDTFDPRIMYDAVSDRWIVSASTNAEAASAALLVGVSQTGDPGGNWNLYRINVGPTVWGDYPVLGFNANWVVISLNLFRVAGSGSYRGTNLFVFKKSDLFGGSSAFRMFTDTFGDFTPVRDFDNVANTMYFVQAFGDSTGGLLRMSKLSGEPGSESFQGGNVASIELSDAWADSGDDAGDDFAPQRGTSAKIDTGDGRMQSCVMRAGSIWCAHTAFLPAIGPTRSVVQWFQITPAGKVLQRGRIEDPSNNYFYAYPSIAVNKNLDVMLGFTRFSVNDYPSAEFAFRTQSDPQGAMQQDVLFKSGESAYVVKGVSSDSNRWGDFSNTMVDPADDLSFWTIQEYSSALLTFGVTSAPPSTAGRSGTWWAKVTAPSTNLRCPYSLSSQAQITDSGASAGSVDVATTAGCPWMAASNVPWIKILAGTPGSGAGTVTYSVSANPVASSPRTGTITIAGLTFNVSQGTAPASVDLAVTAVNAPAAAQSGQQLPLSATVANQSANSAGAFRIGFYLSTGAAVTTSDTLLSSCAIPSLAGKSSTTCNTAGALPAIRPGVYTIGALADDLHQLADPDLSNNTKISDSGALTITTDAVKPLFPNTGVVSAASYAGGGVSPGEIVTIFGTNLGLPSVQAPAVTDGQVGTVAGATRVLFDGVAAPLIYAFAGQVSAVAPFRIEGRATTQVQVEYLGVPSDPVSIRVVPSHPAVFTLNRSGTGTGAILNQDYSPNGAAAPAPRGTAIMIYATGGGVPAAAVFDGALATSAVSLNAPVSVTIGGISAKVLYAGSAPGLINGVVQINAVIPNEIAPGDADLEVTIGAAKSQPGVTVAVR